MGVLDDPATTANLEAWATTPTVQMVRIGSHVAKAKRMFAATGNAIEERLAVQRYQKQNAVISIQKIFRGHSGRVKATLALEIANFSSPHLMKTGMIWERRAVKALVYMMVIFLVVFAMYLNLIFGIKFDKDQQNSWVEGFVTGLSLELSIGIPIQIVLMRILPHEVTKAIIAALEAIVSVYILNGLAGSELIAMSWFEQNVKSVLMTVFRIA